MAMKHTTAALKHGSGPYHGKDKNVSTKARRKRSWDRCQIKKDRNVKRSSHGRFSTAAQLEKHHSRVSA